MNGYLSVPQRHVKATLERWSSLNYIKKYNAIGKKSRNLPLQSLVQYLDVSFICWTKAISWDDSQTNNCLSISSPFHSFIWDSFVSSPLLLGINSGSSVWLSSELDAVAKLSWRHFSMPLITRVSFTAFWVLYFILLGLENCNLVLFPHLYSSSFHFAGSVNVCLLPTPFPRFSAPFFPLSTACFFLSASTSYVSFEAVPSWNAIWYYSCAHLPEIHLLSRGQTYSTLG